ncbi:hypothetical protein [Azohydromonas sp.]|uniref:hypothetical protein n=1 Tax=Azohydromonas sp. TaxID=1872666 RepID=UPI002C7272FC|nr:hypothetical protein [Azohydromonas sp.]HMM87495.1 hypothetical protein [Azohydromonas sp.]
MSTITIVTPALAPVDAPRGARWASEIVVRLWRAISRAFATPPTAADVAGLRRYAASLQPNDPRFAADLFAAADRHEREIGA